MPNFTVQEQITVNRWRKLLGINKTVVRSGGQNKHNIVGTVRWRHHAGE